MNSYSGFDTVPSGSKGEIEPFQLHVPDSELADFHTLLRLSKIGPDTWENRTATRDGGGHYFGITRDWLSNAKDTWLTKFDWREHEAVINSFPNFKKTIRDGDDILSIHFTALFSRKKDAVPVIFMHGWPGSFLEFLPVLEILRTKYTADTLPFHAIIPSLPGYGLSSGPPLDRDFSVQDIARILNQLMVELGFGNGYVAQGGDIGYFLARRLSIAHDECKAFHVNFLGAPPEVDQSNTEGLEPEEVQAMEKAKNWRVTGIAYGLEHATRPATIGLVLSSSPLALLGWIGEKYLEWADTPIPVETILRQTSLYWFTSSLPRCIYPYRSLLLGEGDGPSSTTKPLGYSAFKDIRIMPKAWSKYFPNMKFRKDHSKGGHFAALEQPQAFLEDVEEFLKIIGPVCGKAQD